VNSYHRPFSDRCADAAVRQPEQPSSAAEQRPLTEDRSARVAELREQYRLGTYQVAAAELSASIIDKHLKR